MLELFEPLLWMVACWGAGLVTGLGLGSGITRNQMARVFNRED